MYTNVVYYLSGSTGGNDSDFKISFVIIKWEQGNETTKSANVIRYYNTLEEKSNKRHKTLAMQSQEHLLLSNQINACNNIILRWRG